MAPNITLGVMGPVITAFSGVQGASSDGVQIATGVGSLLGLPAGALLSRVPIKSAGPAATIAFALNSSMVFLGQGLGATLGGIVTATFSLSWIGVSGAAIALCGLSLSFFFDK